MSRRRKKPKKRPPRVAALQTFEAPFADAFPPDDAVGHFVISFAAAHNDLQLTNRLLFPPEHPDRNGLSPAENVALLRLILAQLWETHLLVQASSEIPETAAFVGRVAREYRGDLAGPDLMAALRGEAGATAPKFRNLLRVARNTTTHYRKPDAPEFHAALASLSGEPARIVTSARMHTLRAEFADDVMLRMALNIDESETQRLFAELADSVIAVIHLAQTAIDLWMADHGAREVYSE